MGPSLRCHFEIFPGLLGAKRKLRDYDMGCDCGIQAKKMKKCLNENFDKRRDSRIIGGCLSGHTPWFLSLDMTGDF